MKILEHDADGREIDFSDPPFWSPEQGWTGCPDIADYERELRHYSQSLKTANENIELYRGIIIRLGKPILSNAKSQIDREELRPHMKSLFLSLPKDIQDIVWDQYKYSYTYGLGRCSFILDDGQRCERVEKHDGNHFNRQGHRGPFG